jgi:hypothetical protein
MLLRAGYPPALLLSEWRLGYLEALSQADTGRYNGLVNLIGRAVEQGLDLYLAACDRSVAEDDPYLPLAVLAEETPYSADYLALLIRKGRLAAIKRGRQWFSTHAAVERYRSEVAESRFTKGRPSNF